MAKGRKVRASRAAQGYVEFSHFPPAVHFDLIRKQAVVIPALDRKSGSAGMPRPISYAVFCLKKKKHLREVIWVDPALLGQKKSVEFKMSAVNGRHIDGQQ